jgi:RNA polymerase sigma-70 factor (ECF subfamily)
MVEDLEFAEFLRRIRAGDATAAEELVRRYESLIRREVRLRLHDPSLTRLFDSLDVCQSVMASFFVRAAAGQYDLEQPAQLLALLIKIARNKVAMAARRHRTQRRDLGRVASVGVDEINPADAGATPSRVIEARDLLNQVQEQLSAEERQIADLRAQGHGWADVAQQLGGTADGRRVQFARAMDRVVHALGLEEQEP